MEMASGRNFSPEFATDNTDALLINEAAADAIGWDKPLGKKIQGYEPNPRTIIGVVKDFHFSSPHRKIAPLFISNRMDRLRAIFVRIKPVGIAAALDFLEKKWKKFDPARPFEYYFLDESFEQQYRADEKLSKIFSNFTFFAIFIACLGLLGLISYAAEQRTKEIGIRKTLGASVPNIVVLLSREFALMVLIANIIAWPTAYLALNKWLQNFAYKTEINPWIFVMSAFLALVIAILTISFQSVKAALANPVDSLKYE